MNQKIEFPSVSIIIPTYTSSAKYISMCIKAIKAQNYPEDKIEIIIADNHSHDDTVDIAKSLDATVFFQDGKPSQACNQRNLGAMNAKSDYVIFLDHDMEMSPNLLKNFSEKVLETDNKIDAWFVPEKIVASSKLLTKLRNFERSYYDTTAIDAARIIKKEVFLKTQDMYDPMLSNGPADWDMDLQLKELGCRFGIIDEAFYHHEEKLSLLKYITKKGNYVKDSDFYGLKWRKRNYNVYKKIIKGQQFGVGYRFFTVFFEKGKWKKTVKYFHLYLALLCIRFIIGIMVLRKKISL